MLKNAYTKQRHGIWQNTLQRVVLLFLFCGLVLISLVGFSKTNRAEAVTSSTLNFQGRLLTNTGGLVPDGNYTMEFKIYDSENAGASAPGICSLNSSSDDCWWRETRTVTVQNGYYSVYLGDVNNGGTAFTAGLPWDQELWLTMNVNSDGEMTPRFKLTAVPYAFRAGALVDASGSAKTAGDFAQLAPTSVQAVNAAVSALRISQAGSGGLLQLQSGSTDVFTVNSGGGTVLGSSSIAGLLTLRDGNGQGTTIQAGDSTSNLTFTLPTTLGLAQQCLRNGATPGVLEFGDCGSGAVMPFASKTKTISETQNNIVNPTATLQADDELFFNIGANETWNFRFQLQATVNITPDIKFSVSGPAGATCVTSFADIENAVSIANVVGCGSSSGGIPVTTGVDVFEVSGSITNGSSAGTVTLNWAQNTANAANTIVHAGSFVEASRSVGGSSADVAFIQNGNTFGGLAVLGTNDANGLAFETDGIERMQLLATGEIRASDDLVANRTVTGVTGTTSGTGTNTTTLTLTADTFEVNDVVLIDNVGQDYYTRVTSDPGTGSYTVSPAVTYENTRTVTKYLIQNVGATELDYANQANRFFQGYFLGGVVVGAGSTIISDGNIESTTGLTLQANGGNVSVGGGLTVTGTIAGDGSGLTNINGANISGSAITGLDASNIAVGTLTDGRLSTNVALLSGSQTFTGVKDFSAGLTVSSGGVSATGNITATAQISGARILGDGSGLSNLEAGDIASGTLNDGRLSTNVALLTGNQTFTGSKTFLSGGLVLGQTTFSSSATVARAVSFPDEAGTVCLSNADTCGFLRLAPSTAQTDASNNDVLSVNKTSATGNLINLQRSGTPVFTIANSGALQIQASSANALDIRNAGGLSYFIVDTNTGEVQVGSQVADASGVLFVLDTKNTNGDPTGSVGAQYYNSARGTFRCFENGRGWTDCIGAPKPNTRRTARFIANGTSATLTSDGGDVATVSGAGSAQPATTVIPPSVNYATGAGTNSDAGISGNVNYNSSSNPSMQANVRLATTLSTRNWVGFTNQTLATMNASANPAGIYAAFRYDTSAGDVNWQCITKNGGAQTVLNSGVAGSTTNVELEIIIVTGTNVEFKINGVLVCTSTANLPAPATLMRHVASRRNLVFGAQSLQVAWLYMESEQ